MSLLEQQNLLARLYTDPAFLEEFYSKPQDIGSELGLTQAEIAELSEVARDEVKRFSDSLIWKRLREVEKMLPVTSGSLGEGFEKAFFEFAASFNPQGIKKHYEDSVEFCGTIVSDQSFSEIVRRTAKLERGRLRFVNEGRTFAVCRLGPRPFSFAVWLRMRGRVFHFAI